MKDAIKGLEPFPTDVLTPPAPPRARMRFPTAFRPGRVGLPLARLGLILETGGISASIGFAVRWRPPWLALVESEL